MGCGAGMVEVLVSHGVRFRAKYFQVSSCFLRYQVMATCGTRLWPHVVPGYGHMCGHMWYQVMATCGTRLWPTCGTRLWL